MTSRRSARTFFTVTMVALAVLSLLALPPLAAPAEAAAARTGQEQFDEWEFIDRINASRSAAGLSSVTMVSSWRETSRDHSESMAAAGAISHDGNLSGDADAVSSCWSKIGENVGVGSSVSTLHDAFMASDGHRRNVLDAGFRYVGIGVEWRGGRLWVTERFMQLRSGCTLPAASRPTFHWMEVDVTGSGDGTVSSSPTGVACGTDCREPYTSGTRVTLTASPATGSVFRGWTGGGCSGTGACAVTMDQARSVSALFVARHVLTVSPSGSGYGAVTSTPAGIDCGSVCSATYDEGTAITLVATPEPGSAFRGWSGGGCSGEGDCTVTITAATSVTALFVLQYDLEVTIDGSGDGSVLSSPEGIDCGDECVAAFDDGTEVTLTAIAESGSAFAGWEGGDCFGTDECIVTMSEAHSVTAIFVAQHDLDVDRGGTGRGTVTSSPAGIRCGSRCTQTFDEGTDVRLVARPKARSTFVRWTGACAGAGRTCTITITGPRSTTAIFNRRRR
jgi:uncharacterized protein YkwD